MTVPPNVPSLSSAPGAASPIPADSAVEVEEVGGAILDTRWDDNGTAGGASPVQPHALSRGPPPDPVSSNSHEVKPAVKEEAGQPEYGSRQVREPGAQLEAEAEHRRSFSARSPSPPSSSNVLPSRPTGWTVEAHQALIRGLALFPFLGRGMRFFLIDGQRYNRNRLLNEYIRRQTGCTFNYDKIQQAIGQLRTEYKEAANPPRGLGTDKLDDATLETCDWKALLGEDSYPETKAASEAADAKAQKKRTMASREASRRKHSKRSAFTPEEDDSDLSSSSHPSSPPPPKKPAHRLSRSTSKKTGATQPPPSLLSFQNAVSPAYFPQAYPPSRPAAFYPVVWPTSYGTPPHTLYLQAVLTCAFPSHDYSPAAVAFSSAGLSTLDDLHRLLVLEDFLVEPLVEMVVKRAKLSGLEAGWLRKALDRLRSSFAAEAG